MSSGTSERAREIRSSLLEHNLDAVYRAMLHAGLEEPVGLILDMTDRHGKAIASDAMKSQGKSDNEIQSLIAAYNTPGHIPTFSVIVEMDIAKQILSQTSSTALDSLSKQKSSKHLFVIVIGAGGNLYHQVERSELDFDIEALSYPTYKEDAVREDIITPILKKAGYRATGINRMERSKPLTHPEVLIGSKKIKVNIIPDYTLYHEDKPILTVEAKAPTEEICGTNHTYQAYSYAIHPDIRCSHYALCNGREFVIYHISSTEPLFRIMCADVRRDWDSILRYLKPENLMHPERIDFLPDFGLRMQALGIDGEIILRTCVVQSLSRVTDGYYVAHSSAFIGTQHFALTIDFFQDAYSLLLLSLPLYERQQIDDALVMAPYSINTDGKIRIDIIAKPGSLINGPYEQYIPYITQEFIGVQYDKSFSYGTRHPKEIEFGVPIIKSGLLIS